VDAGNGVGVDVRTSLVEDGELHTPASVSTCFDFKIEQVLLHVVKCKELNGMLSLFLSQAL